MGDKPPGDKSIATAIAFALINGVWTALVLGVAVAQRATCAGGYRPNEQSCEVDTLALGLLWFIGQLVLVVPTGWAAHVLTWAERTRPPSNAVRVGLLGIAATLAIPVGLLALGFVIG